MSTVREPAPSGTLRAAVVLTAVAGFADAHIFLHVIDVFVANMSGNLVFLGIAAGEGRWREGLRHGAALVAFVLGAAAATWFYERRLRANRPLRPDLVIAVEAGLLLLVTLWVALDDGGDQTRAIAFPTIALGACAMGMQTSALLRVGAVAVTTTYTSGSVAHLGTESVLAVGAGNPSDRAPHRQAIGVLAAVVVAYVAGAASAAWAGSADALLLVPVAVLAGMAIMAHRRGGGIGGIGRLGGDASDANRPRRGGR